MFSALGDDFEQTDSFSDENDSDFDENKKINNENESICKNNDFLEKEVNKSIKLSDLFENNKNKNEFFNETKKIELKNKQKQNKFEILSKFDKNILILAKKAKMKTLLEKQIFCTIMSSAVFINFFICFIKKKKFFLRKFN